jgi:glycosyltransferase involved in cell wall biosynthesis
VSDFYADFFPALLIKLIYPKTKWISGYFLFAPKPNDPNSPYIKTGQTLKGIFYYLSQRITYHLTKLLADYVFVTSDPDVSRFISQRLPKQKIIVIRGGVDISHSSKYLRSHTLVPTEQRKYSACFMGRLHPQKGVLELIDIWKIVVDLLPKSKLALIGNGQLESQVINKIKKLKLDKNIDLFGFLDGEKKDAIFRNSCLVLHPAIYDSGGMASAEAMAWGLPAVSFDLEALKTYYPKGMVKIPCYDLKLFAQTIIELLRNKKYYSKVSKDSIELITEFWDWDKQAKNIYRSLGL